MPLDGDPKTREPEIEQFLAFWGFFLALNLFG
jgi:hypothetical protein